MNYQNNAQYRVMKGFPYSNYDGTLVKVFCKCGYTVEAYCKTLGICNLIHLMNAYRIQYWNKN